MDTFWVIPLLIFAAIVSIGQKASKKASSKQEESDAMPIPEHEDIERRIREILEGKATPTQRPAPRVASAPSKTLEQMPKPIVRRTSTVIPNKIASTKQANKHIKKSATNKIDTDLIKQGEIKHSEIGRIIDDFSVEKATIYAEIMKPKYEEY